jgi:pimeloyl-ACP methyl ester carboxylesterase
VIAAWDGLAVTEQGAGPAVLWLHGYTMRAEVWRAVWRQLPGWRHVGLDLPWHGRSRPLRPGEDLAGLADTVVAGARAAGVRHLAALSLGTVLATEMAVRHSDAFLSLTLSAPALAGMPHEPAVARRYADLAALYRRSGAGPHMTALWMSYPPAIFAGVAARPAVDAGLRAVVDRHRWRELPEGGMQRLLERPQRAGDLARVAASVLVLVGDGDLLFHRACARSIVAATPSASLRVLPGTGHLAPLEEPAAAAAVIEAHLLAANARRDR